MMMMGRVRERLGWTLVTLAMAAFLTSACSDDNEPTKDASPKESGPDVVAVDAVKKKDVPQVGDQRVGDQGGDRGSGDIRVGDRGVEDFRAGDQSVDIVIGGDALAFPLCAKAGGGCTAQRWVTCPAGTQPASGKPHLDCGAGWCCVKAPPSTCTQSGAATCVEATKCTGCWGPPSDTTLVCPAGRVCCQDICD